MNIKPKKQLILNFFKYVSTNFITDQCFLRASALTYVTALSLVPFLAVAFSISKGIGFQNMVFLKNFLYKISAGRTEVVTHIIDYINNTNVGTLGAVGVGMLIITVFTLLGNIEKTFNSIWGVKAQRTFARKFADYLSVTLVCPLFVIVAISFTASLESSAFVQTLLDYSVFSFMRLITIKLLPYALIILAIFFMYIFIPNKKINLKYALAGSFFAGILWQISQKMFINYQIGVSKYNAIYGSFAQLPLFLIWLYLSWLIVLLGAEIGSSLENFDSRGRKSLLGGFNLELKEKVALAIMIILTAQFERNKKILSEGQIAQILDVPSKIIQQIMSVLIRLGFVTIACQEDKEGYILSTSPYTFTCLEFLQKFRQYREESDLKETKPVSSNLDDCFQRMQSKAKESEANLKLVDFARNTSLYETINI